MQELGAQNPILLTLLASNAEELPRRDEKDEFLDVVVKLHIGRWRHLDSLGVTLSILDDVEFDVGEGSV